MCHALNECCRRRRGEHQSETNVWKMWFQSTSQVQKPWAIPTHAPLAGHKENSLLYHVPYLLIPFTSREMQGLKLQKITNERR